MDGERLAYLFASVLGIAGGGLAWWMSPSGRNALVLSLIPILGFGLGTAFC
jgi:hypothetical protein